MLFCDVAGFTPLSETRDPKAVRELLSCYFEVARPVRSERMLVVLVISASRRRACPDAACVAGGSARGVIRSTRSSTGVTMLASSRLLVAFAFRAFARTVI